MEGKRKNGYPAPAVRHGSHRSTINLYLTLGAAALAAIGSLLSVNVFFNLSPTGLSINGTTLYAPEQIQLVGGLAPGQNLIRLNTDFVEKRLKENLVYVDEVEVIKDYPESLIINIKEAKPKAQIEYEGGYCTVSSSGRLLEIGESERNKKLPLISGFELVGEADEALMSNDGSEPEDGELQAMVYKPVTAGIDAMSADDQKSVIIKQLFDELDRLGFKKIARIDIADRTDIKLVYDGRIVIELGSSVDLDIKLGYIQAVLEKLPDGYEGILRYNGIERGISAIPKKTEVQQAASTSTNPAESSSAPDQSGEQQWGEQQWNDWGYNDTPDYGYSDYNDYGYYDGYTDYGYDYNYGYDDYDYGYGSYDYNYGYDDYGYGGYDDYGYDYGYDDYGW